MANIETWFEQDLMKPVQVRNLGNVFNQDKNGNLIGVKLKKDGEDYEIPYSSVNGYCVLADGSTVPVLGGYTGNKAYVILPQSAYGIIGPIAISIKLNHDDAITTICACTGMVTRSRTNVQADPGQVIDDWGRAINAALAAVETAAENVGSIVASSYDASATYQVGDYATYMGNLYRCTTEIDTAEYWTAEHWTATTVGNELINITNNLDIATVADTKSYLDIS